MPSPDPIEYQFFEPSACDDVGNTPVPYVIKGHWSKGKSMIIIDEPAEAIGYLGVCWPGAVRQSTDTIPRRLTPEEIIQKCRTGVTRKD